MVLKNLHSYDFGLAVFFQKTFPDTSEVSSLWSTDTWQTGLLDESSLCLFYIIIFKTVLLKNDGAVKKFVIRASGEKVFLAKPAGIL